MQSIKSEASEPSNSLFTGPFIESINLNFEPTISTIDSPSPAHFPKKTLLLNALIKMNLNLTISKNLINQMKFESDWSLERYLNIFLDKYYQNEPTNESYFSKPSLVKEITESFGSCIPFNKSPKKNHEPNSKSKKKAVGSFFIRISINNLKETQNLECPICLEPKREEQMLVLSSSHKFCRACLSEYLLSSMKAHQIIDIKCPDGCGKLIVNNDIQCIFASQPKKIEKFQKIKISDAISRNPWTRWCIRPSCNGTAQAGSNMQKIVCNDCRTKICSICRNEWHQNKTCEQYINELLEKKLQSIEVKNCPHCQIPIEKWDMSNHIVCASCKHEFCWLCLKKSGKHHFAWYNATGCPDMLFSKQIDKRKKFEAWAEIIILVILALILIVFLGLPVLVCFGSVGLFLIMIVRCGMRCKGGNI